MIQVYYDKMSKYYRYFIPIASHHIIIKSASINFTKTNKRRKSARSWFSHLSRISVWQEEIIDLHKLSSFYITEKEFIMWIGRVRVDLVSSLEDLGRLQLIMRNYESVLDKN